MAMVSSETAPASSHHGTGSCGGSAAQSSSDHHSLRPLHESPSRADYDVPDAYTNLDEVEDPAPVQNREDTHVYRHTNLEEIRSEDREDEQNCKSQRHHLSPERSPGQSCDRPRPRPDLDETLSHHPQVSRFATQLYTISYLIFFSILGTLARMGLTGLTFYPGAPVAFSVLWSNFGGSLFMGFLSEDRKLFKQEWGVATFHEVLQKSRQREQDEECGVLESKDVVDLAAAKRADKNGTKKTIPLYIGMATGFCGSFTSFSSFMRDAFLSLSNRLPTPLNHPADYSTHTSTATTVPRNGGYAFMDVIGVIIITVTVSTSALFIGAHLAIALERFTPTVSFSFCRRVLDRAAVLLGWGCWLGAVLLAIWPPDRSSSSEAWRGRAVFSIVFAPLGCLGRFYASIYLNGKIPSFPLGTFVVNMTGTAILGMTWDLQRVPLGGVAGCQVFQGIQDGFCGTLTTVSTWVSELTSLRRSHSYRYGTTSVIAGLCLLILIMGSFQWSHGLSEIQCITN